MALTLHHELDVDITIYQNNRPLLVDISDRLTVRNLYRLLFAIALAFLPSLVTEVRSEMPRIRVSWSIPIPQRLLDFGSRCSIVGIWSKHYLRCCVVS